MQKVIALILAVCLWLVVAPSAHAEFKFSTLTPCGDSPAFQERLQAEVDSYTARLEKFAPNSPQYKYLEAKIAATEARFNNYANSSLLCGEDGLPHLISDGRWDHAGEFIIPSLLFLYIAGWIGWVGRDYLRAIRQDTDTATEKEIIIDTALAIKFMLSGFLWPLAAIKEFTTGELLAKDEEISVSPR
ncbi:MAG: Photosystem I reaction center subunit III [Pseudanabaenaceae cyanobacterium]